MTVTVQGRNIYLNGIVGEDPFFDCFSAGEVIVALSKIKASDKITVHINSPGGWATEGAAIHALLSARSGETNVVVDGLAASAASLIAMAGKTVSMSAGSLLMIHEPHGMTIGHSEDHQRQIRALEAIGDSYAEIYALKSGKSASQCRELMKAETWFTPADAVAAGFADKAIAQPVKAFAAFDYSKFTNAPAALIALSKEKNWASAGTRPTTPKKETVMTDEVAAQARAEVAARIRAIMSLPQASTHRDLAEYVAFETELTEDQAKALLAKAAPASTVAPAQSYEERRIAALAAAQLNPLASLASPSISSPTPSGGGLVANMKRRHGVS
jgi:ATP-dependent protease ClpP protease subunit